MAVMVIASEKLNSVRYLKTVSGVKVISASELNLAEEKLEAYFFYVKIMINV
jgi:hypothetical protein